MQVRIIIIKTDLPLLILTTQNITKARECSTNCSSCYVNKAINAYSFLNDLEEQAALWTRQREFT